ncbi:MAG: hypothetical protein JW797_04840 [Bradymonadales bacterium]|nr:hypothetical protein [Bradymonadales bacterium]
MSAFIDLRVFLVAAACFLIQVAGVACRMDTSRLDQFACSQQEPGYCQTNFPGTCCRDGYCHREGCQQVCQPNESYCADGVFHQCSADGMADSTTSCELGCNQSGTACNVCVPGSSVCADDTQTTCSQDGVWQAGVDCSPYGCNASGTVCNQCEPSTTTCDEDTLVVCAADGTITSSTSCDPYGCNTAGTACNQCVPSTTSCDEDTLVVCAADGTITSSTSCDPYGCSTTGTACNQCEPSTSTCSAGTQVNCSAEGVPEAGISCGDFGCNTAATVCNECEPSTTSCDEDTLVVCAADGTITTSTSCDPYGCNTAGTACNQCEPETTTCSEDTLVVCAADGTITSSTSCDPYGCSTTGTACNLCVPSTTSCDEDTLVVCAADGTITSSTSCDPYGCSTTGTACNQCEPSTSSCTEGTQINCSAEGVPQAGIDCSPYGCSILGTVCNQCEPSTSTCTEGSQVDCSAEGVLQPEIDCDPFGCNPAGTLCNECNPGTLECSEGTLVLCRADGTIETSTDCDPYGCSITGSACNECDPSTSTCSADTQVDCSAEGVLQEGIDCDPYGCNPAGTLCNECFPSTNSCAENTLVVCAADGTITSSTSCSPYGCSITGTACNECEPSTSTCSADTQVDCSAEGVAQPGIDCDPYGCNPAETLCNECHPSTFECRGGISVSCNADGTILEEEDCDAVDGPCAQGECVVGTGKCETTLETPGTSCDDGLTCTSDTECDVEGFCTGGTNDDSICEELYSGDLCRPLCSLDSTGCVTPPEAMTLSCTPAVAVSGTSSTCDMTLDGLTGQADWCIDCISEVGVTVLVHTDFEDDENPGQCAPQLSNEDDGWTVDGWTLLTDSSCTNSIDAGNCNFDEARTCCPYFLCTLNVGQTTGAAFTANDDHCADGDEYKEGWGLERTFDTRGLTDIELCYGYADRWASNDDDVLYVEVSDGSGNQAEDCDGDGPRDGVDNQFYRVGNPNPDYSSSVCWELPGWAENDPALTIRFILHSDDGNDIIYLDDITLKGWYAGCADPDPTYSTILNEDFNTSCPELGDWTVSGDLSCISTDNESGFGTSPHIHVTQGQSGSIERTLDLSTLDGDITLCFGYGDNHADNDESLRVQFDVGGGVGWQDAWYQVGSPGPNNDSVQICANLSDLDPRVNRNPAVGLRFTLTSDDTTEEITIDVDDIAVQGAVFCDGSPWVNLSDPVDGGDGAYQFTVSGTAGEQLTADILCSWDDPPLGAVEAMDSVWFTP